MWLNSQRLTTYVQYAGAATQYTEYLMNSVQAYPRIDGHKIISSSTTSVSAVQGTRAYNYHASNITTNFIGVDPTDTYIAYGGNFTPFVFVYKRSGNTMTLLSTSSFDVQPTGSVNGCAWSHDGTRLVLTMQTSPYIHIYNRSGDTFTKVTNPGTLPPSQATQAAWSPDDSILAVGHNNTPFITIYNRSGDTYTKVANPATLPGGQIRSVAWNGSGTSLAAYGQTTPFLTVYNFSGTSTYTAIATANFNVAPASGYAVDWSPDGTQVSLALAASPYFRSYYRSGDNFYSATGDVNPNGQPFAIAWNSSSNSVVLGQTLGGMPTQGIAIYNLTGTSTFTRVTAPNVQPNATVHGVYWTTSTNKLYTVFVGNPVLLSYSRSGDTFTPDSIFDNPAVSTPFNSLVSAAVNRISWSTTGSYLAQASTNALNTRIYQFNTTTQLFTSSDLTINFTNVTANDIIWSPDDQWLATAISSSPYVQWWSRSGNTFTQQSNPVNLPPAQGNGVMWNNTASSLAVAHNGTPFVTIYNRSGTTLTKLANPTNLPAGTGNAVAWNNTASSLAVAHATTPFITIYNRSGDTFTKLANPANLPAGQGFGLSWHPNDNLLAISHATSPFITIYSRSGDTFTRLAQPSVIPTAQGQNIKWNRAGDKLAIISPNETIVYQYTGTSTFNAISIDQGQYNMYGNWGLSWSESF